MAGNDTAAWRQRLKHESATAGYNDFSGRQGGNVLVLGIDNQPTQLTDTGVAGVGSVAVAERKSRRKTVPHFAPSHDFLFHLSDETTTLPKDPPPMLKQYVNELTRKRRVLPPHQLPPKASTVQSAYSFARRDVVPPMILAKDPTAVTLPPRSPRANGSDQQQQRGGQGASETEDSECFSDTDHGTRRRTLELPPLPSTPTSTTKSVCSSRLSSRSASVRGGEYLSEQRLRSIEETLEAERKEHALVLTKVEQLQKLLEDHVKQSNSARERRGNFRPHKPLVPNSARNSAPNPLFPPGRAAGGPSAGVNQESRKRIVR